MESFAAQYLAQSAQAAAALAADTGALSTLHAMAARITTCLAGGGRLLLAGNGGSAADCAHLAGELQSRCHRASPPFAAINLAGEAASLTAFANDYGVHTLFARGVQALGREGDVLLALSTSGNSPNILEALRQARAQALFTCGFTGAGGGAMAPLCDLLLKAPGTQAQIIQQLHITAGHTLLGLIEHALAGDPPA